MPRMRRPPEIPWREPRDLTAELCDGELSSSIFNVLDQPDWRELIEPQLDGTRHRYFFEAHFDQAAYDRDDRALVVTGPLEVVRFASDARDWRTFADDYFEACRMFIDWQRIRAKLTARKIR